eukprot:TRINITY_DN5649_c3_g1_i1.p1 TRINITY_DN5649_c3_g1~~TRINITY_DN5649_c3_g1_i1.p1  ORF type:complete len:712 (+),score=126.61 TRINITY_DN5649_c3_g1_i1:105-2138(+)
MPEPVKLSAKARAFSTVSSQTASRRGVLKAAAVDGIAWTPGGTQPSPATAAVRPPEKPHQPSPHAAPFKSGTERISPQVKPQPSPHAAPFKPAAERISPQVKPEPSPLASPNPPAQQNGHSKPDSEALQPQAAAVQPRPASRRMRPFNAVTATPFRPASAMQSPQAAGLTDSPATRSVDTRTESPAAAPASPAPVRQPQQQQFQPRHREAQPQPPQAQRPTPQPAQQAAPPSPQRQPGPAPAPQPSPQQPAREGRSEEGPSASDIDRRVAELIKLERAAADSRNYAEAARLKGLSDALIVQRPDSPATSPSHSAPIASPPMVASPSAPAAVPAGVTSPSEAAATPDTAPGGRRKARFSRDVRAFVPRHQQQAVGPEASPAAGRSLGALDARAAPFRPSPSMTPTTPGGGGVTPTGDAREPPVASSFPADPSHAFVQSPSSGPAASPGSARPASPPGASVPPVASPAPAALGGSSPAMPSASPRTLPADADDEDEIPLQSLWTLWFRGDDSAPVKGQSSWTGSLRSVLEGIGSVQRFWGVFNNIAAPSALPNRSGYYLFKAGVKPAWEDPACQRGGDWKVWVSGDDGTTDAAWLSLSLHAVGDQIGGEDEVCGVAVESRQGRYRLSLWISSVDKPRALSIGRSFRGLLAGFLPTSTPLYFTSHSQALAGNERDLSLVV